MSVWNDIRKRCLGDEAKNEADKASAEVKNWEDMPVLGCYDRNSKKILLYPNNMKQDKERYLVTTFVHETMHDIRLGVQDGQEKENLLQVRCCFDG